MPGVSGSGGIEFLSSWFALRFDARRESRDRSGQAARLSDSLFNECGTGHGEKQRFDHVDRSQSVGTRVEAGLSLLGRHSACVGGSRVKPAVRCEAIRSFRS